MKRGGVEHLKTVRLARALGVPHLVAVGLLESLWHFTVKHAIRGDIGRATDEEIEAGVRWPELSAAIPNTKPLVPTLIACGFLDLDEQYRLLVHDWPEHADQSVKKTLSNRGHDFARTSGEPISGNVPSERVEEVTPVTGKATALERKGKAVSTEEEDRTAARARPVGVLGADPYLNDYIDAWTTRFRGAAPMPGIRAMVDELREHHPHAKIKAHWRVYLDPDLNQDDPRFLSPANFKAKFAIYDPDCPGLRRRPTRTADDEFSEVLAEADRIREAREAAAR
jgi:hypothetical protein